MAPRKASDAGKVKSEAVSSTNGDDADEPRKPTTDSWARILYEMCCPRLPEEGFFGPLDTPYVTNKGASNMKAYKYDGGDLSLIYKYILSPLAEALVVFVPNWIAPNTITLISFIIALLNHAIIAFYSWDMKSSAPNWAWTTLGISVIVYQTLDNMDGKQARRLGMGSPLGLLFDHGIDALNCGLLVLNLICLFASVEGWGHIHTFILFFSQMMPFVFCTWEEFFLGALFLPIINGPSEGLLTYAGICLLTGYFGTTFWEQKIFGRYLWIYLLITYAMLAVNSVRANFFAVLTTKKKDVLRRHAYGAAIPMFLGMALTAFIVFYPDTSILDSSPRLFLSFLSVIYSNLTIHLQLAHIQHMTFYPWRKTFILPLIILAGNSVLRCYGYYIVNLDLLMAVCYLVALLSSTQMILRTVHEVAHALDINIFTVPDDKKKKK